MLSWGYRRFGCGQPGVCGTSLTVAYTALYRVILTLGLLYLGRGLRPDVSPVKRERAQYSTHVISPTQPPVTLVDAVIVMMQSREAWEDTATELLSILNGSVDDIP